MNDKHRSPKLVPRLVPSWPKLAWVARMPEGASIIEVLHGPMVEVGDEWIVEAVWAGEFADGDFDRTDLVFGTGIRCRSDRVTFVTSGTVFDRLWHCRNESTLFIANSLPALLAVSGLNLRDGYPSYSKDVMSIASGGLDGRIRTIPTQTVDITSVYYNNIVLEECRLEEIPKPDTAQSFKCFEDYYQFLVDTAILLGDNSKSPKRTKKVFSLAGISSGYDSCATATIARLAGCNHTVTIGQSNSFWRGSDSGGPVAEQLGMTCMEYPRTAKSYPLEETIWAAEGRGGILNWTLFDYPEPLCLFFTGCHGEKMWDRVDHDHPDPFVRRDTSSLGFTEYRLHHGVFQCVMPFWGVRHSRELRAITLSENMVPWYINRDYDKPVARRIVEDAGVSRKSFGMLKKNTSHESTFCWPYSPRALASLKCFLKDRGMPDPSAWVVGMIRRLAHIDSLFHKNITRRFGLKKRRRFWDSLAGPSLLFQWANSELKKMYEQGLKASGMERGLIKPSKIGDH